MSFSLLPRAATIREFVCVVIALLVIFSTPIYAAEIVSEKEQGSTASEQENDEWSNPYPTEIWQRVVPALELELDELPIIGPDTKPLPSGSAIKKRVEEEKKTAFSRFVITPHKPNYVLPLSYNSSPNNTPFLPLVEYVREEEVKFQFSFKLPLVTGLFHDRGQIDFAYTNQSFWQLYNHEYSAPFRDTNHEPEVYFSYRLNHPILGINADFIQMGYSHQSNGRTQPLSRSWNRLYLNFVFERGDYYFSFKPWYRIREDKKDDPSEPKGDDNRDIEFYMGHFELTALYKPDENTYSLVLRNNLRSENRGAIQVDWSFPLTSKLRGYVQFFNGYGESMLDYNDSANRIGFGLQLTDWL